MRGCIKMVQVERRKAVPSDGAQNYIKKRSACASLWVLTPNMPVAILFLLRLRALEPRFALTGKRKIEVAEKLVDIAAAAKNEHAKFGGVA